MVSRQVPKRSWAYLNDTDDSSSSSTSVLSNGGERKRKRGVSGEVSAGKRTKRASSSSNTSVENLYSCLTEEDVRRLFETANISSTDYEFLVPSKSQRASRPPQGYISVYEDQITAGLRFPMHDMLVRVCNLIQVSPSQLAPNAYRVIVGYILCAMLYEIPMAEATLFSLVEVMYAKQKGLFTFRPIGGNNFLEGKPVSNGSWKKKFFYLSRKGNPWSCRTEWSKTFTRPTYDAFLAEAAIKKGIMNNRFRVIELLCKKLLIHGGIEPGVPSTEHTFRFLMHKAAVTKFDLSPENMPPVCATIGEIRTIRQKINSSTTPLLVAHTSPPTLTASDASLAQPRDEQLANHQQLQSTTNGTDIPSETDTPSNEHLPASSKENIPPNDNQESEPCEAHKETNFPVTVLDETEQQPIPPGLRTLWQNIVSEYVPKDHYQKLEEDFEELSSELTYTKWRNQELEQELELSEARSLENEKRTYLANENTKNFERKAEDIQRTLDPELENAESQIQELERQLKASEGRRVDSEKKISLVNEDMKILEKKVEDIQSELNQILDSELARKELRIQELVLQLEVSEAKRNDSEKKTHWANEELKILEKRAENIHRTLGSKLESTKLRIQELELELEVSEKLTHFAHEDIENLEKELKDGQRIHDSELARAKSQIQELERALAVSEAKRADSEKKIELANEDKKSLEKRIEYERNRARDAVDEFKSSEEFLMFVEEKALEVFDAKVLSIY